jgi:hypothetical protein
MQIVQFRIAKVCQFAALLVCLLWHSPKMLIKTGPEYDHKLFMKSATQLGRNGPRMNIVVGQRFQQPLKPAPPFRHTYPIHKTSYRHPCYTEIFSTILRVTCFCLRS